jgi:hypothetical protein
MRAARGRKRACLAGPFDADNAVVLAERCDELLENAIACQHTRRIVARWPGAPRSTVRREVLEVVQREEREVCVVRLALVLIGVAPLGVGRVVSARLWGLVSTALRAARRRPTLAGGGGGGGGRMGM